MWRVTFRSAKANQHIERTSGLPGAYCISLDSSYIVNEPFLLSVPGPDDDDDDPLEKGEGKLKNCL